MKQYGIVDIGSNTIVMIIYEMHDGQPFQVIHFSEPAKLVNYIEEGRMKPEGIQKAVDTLTAFSQKMDEYNVSFRKGFITEPARRIMNEKKFVDACNSTSIEVTPLSGQEEATCDFYGCRLSYPDLMNGAAFDVGGGSTELISFKDGELQDAESIPVGCVRLSHLPLDTEVCATMLEQLRSQHASYNRTWPTLIGIGGTARAAGLVTNAIYQSGDFVKVADLKDVYRKLLAGDTTTMEIMKANVTESRQSVFLPGVHMVLEICKLFHAEVIRISVGGVREGFLLRELDVIEK